MVYMSSKLIFGQVNSISPKVFVLKDLSLNNDFAFVNKMFNKTGYNILEGINAVKKSNNTEGKGNSY